MKILIVGAGIAGLTLASLLKKRDLQIEIIEKAQALDEVGYMIGLYPIGSNVFHGLGCYDEFITQTQAISKYLPFDNNAELLKEFSFTEFISNYGDYQCTTRYKLLEIIRNNCKDLPIQFSTTISSIQQEFNQVIVDFSNGSRANYDLVIGSDGINSQIRNFILNKDEYEIYDTGWGGFVWWEDKNVLPNQSVYEFWGDKFFVGAYPTENKSGIIIATKGKTPEEALNNNPRKHYLLNLAATVVNKYPELFKNFPEDNQKIFYWGLRDVRCKVWHKGRILLLGDAATAFLPTAGVGASMAMESAAVLNDILSRTDKRFLPNALEIYDKRRRKRVEMAQEDSRKLAKIMFVDSYLGSKARDIAFKLMLSHCEMSDFIKNITQAMSTPA